MRGRTWEEILTSRDEYKVKAEMLFEELKTKGVAFDNNTGMGVSEYLQKQREDFKNRYSSDNQIGNFSQGDFNRYERLLGNLKESLANEIVRLNEGMNDNYTLSAFLQYFAELDELEELVRKSKVSIEKQEGIVEMFGEFSTRKRIFDKKGNASYQSKTSQELTDERNERLAILNDLSCSGQISDEEFVNYVNNVVECYNFEIEKCARWEEEHKDKEDKQNKGIKKAIQKVKNLFHKEPPQDKDLADAKRIVNNSGAITALKRAGEMLPLELEGKFIDEAEKIKSATPKIENSEVKGLFVEISEKDRAKNSLVFGKSNPNVEFSPMKTCWDGSCRVKSQEEIVDEMLTLSNQVLNNYKHSTKFILGENGQNSAVYEFEDAQGQHLYDEVCRILGQLSAQRKKCEFVQEQRFVEVDRIIDRFEQNNSKE